MLDCPVVCFVSKFHYKACFWPLPFLGKCLQRNTKCTYVKALETLRRSQASHGISLSRTTDLINPPVTVPSMGLPQRNDLTMYSPQSTFNFSVPLHGNLPGQSTAASQSPYFNSNPVSVWFLTWWFILFYFYFTPLLLFWCNRTKWFGISVFCDALALPSSTTSLALSSRRILPFYLYFPHFFFSILVQEFMLTLKKYLVIASG